MTNIFLLKQYNEYGAGQVINVSTNVAFGLIESGVARKTHTSDFIKKIEMGTTKSFASSPSKGDYIKKKK